MAAMRAFKSFPPLACTVAKCLDHIQLIQDFRLGGEQGRGKQAEYKVTAATPPYWGSAKLPVALVGPCTLV